MLCMTLVEFFADRPHGSRQQMAQALGVSKAWFSQVTQGRRRTSAELCKRIERLTEGKVTRAELRPDLFG